MNVFVASEFSEPRIRPVSDRPADPAGLKEALRTLGGGVSVITAGEGAERSPATTFAVSSAAFSFLLGRLSTSAIAPFTKSST